ncbi:MAG: peptidoglycan-binding protein, partial [Candidatus Omnitrophica bacterium]|nr:peptidoglycan-binding protein [Candidatus Omnitrophota bacterium]
SRFVDKDTWAKLNLFQESGLVFNGELNIATIQTAIKEAGLDPGPVDGKRGRRTDKAIKDFQMQMGLKPDGKIGLRTLKALSAYVPANKAP